MIKVTQKILPFCTLILISVFFSVALAQKKPVSLEDASEMIRHSTQGKVLSAKTKENNGAQSHRIRVLTPSGRVKVYNVPAENTTFSDRNPKRPFTSQPNQQRNQQRSYQNNSNRNQRPQRQYNNNEASRQSRQLDNRLKDNNYRNNNYNNRSNGYNTPDNNRQPIRRDNPYPGQRTNNKNNINKSDSNNNRQQSRSSRGNSQRQ